MRESMRIVLKPEGQVLATQSICADMEDMKDFGESQMKVRANASSKGVADD
jgi:hypothetical protein